MASEPITNPMMNIPVPQSGNAGPSSSSAAKPAPKPSAPPKSSFADELAKGDAAESAQPKAKAPLPEKPKAPVGDRDERSAAAKNADKAADASNKAQESAKKLAPLKKAAQTSKQAIDDAPVVALLTGHLEKVQPTAIPDLVAGNAFVADAISESDIAAFMNKPAKIGDILEDLELPKGLASVAQDMGLDLSHVVTPSELLRAIGVDPGKVAAELMNLKTSLGAEGLAPYMRKAAQLAEQGVQPQQQPLEPYPGWAKSTTAPAVPQSPVTGTFDPTKMTQAGTGLQPTMPKASAASVSSPSVESHPAGVLSQDELTRMVEQNPLAGLGVTPDQLLKMLTPGMAADATKRDDESMTSLSPGAQPLTGLGGLGTSRMSPADLNVAAQIPSLDLSESPKAPQMNRATFDAFNLLGDKLKTMDTQSIDMTKPSPQAIDLSAQQGKASQGRTLEEQLTAAGTLVNPLRTQQPELTIGGGDGPVKTPTAPDTPTTKTVSMADAKARFEGLDQFRPESKPEAEVKPSDVTDRIAAKPAAFVPTASVKDGMPRAMNLSQAVPVDELRLASPMTAGRGGEMTGQDFGGQSKDEGKKDDASFGSFDRALGELGVGKSHHVTVKNGIGVASNAGPEVGLTSEQRLEMFQNVMDRATSLMKDGGGVVRLDFGSAGLGHLEMAVKMNDDKMDLKILTGSDRVKEAMMGELGRLRDALSVQNVQLGQVDVGVNGRQPQSQAFNFNGQAFQQRQQQAFSGEGRHTPDRRASEGLNLERLAEIRRPMPAFAADQLMNSSGSTGRFAVRV